MGRLSQIYWAVNAETYPSAQKQRHYYSHLDLSGPQGQEIKRIRRARARIEAPRQLILGSQTIGLDRPPGILNEPV